MIRQIYKKQVLCSTHNMKEKKLCIGANCDMTVEVTKAPRS